MKLYNLYQEVILEETQKQLQLLSEAVSDEGIKKAIEDRYDAWITYRDYDDGTPPSRRYVQIYVLGVTKAGNEAIRAYQLGGNSAKTKQGGWKTFRVDRIESFNLTGKKWWNPVSDYSSQIPPYNQLGDDSFTSIIAQVDPSQFNRQRSAIPKQANEPEVQEPTNKRVYKPKTRTNRKPEEPEVNVVSGKPKPRTVPEPQAKPEVNKNEPNLGNEKELEKNGNTNTAIR